MSNSSPAISTANLAFVESLYCQFLEDPNSVPEDFRRYFESEHPAAAGVRIGPSFTARSLFNDASSHGQSTSNVTGNGNGSHAAVAKQAPARPVNGNGGANGNGVHANGVVNGNGAYANGAANG